jgi:hypothetical protein
MKIKITELAEQLGTSVNDLLSLKEKLTEEQWSGRGKNTWFTEDAVEVLRVALDIPEIVPNKARGIVLYSARNPNYVYVKLNGKEGKVPVCIPRRMRDKLDGKNINVELITDDTGTSYRYCK